MKLLFIAIWHETKKVFYLGTCLLCLGWALIALMIAATIDYNPGFYAVVMVVLLVWAFLFGYWFMESDRPKVVRSNNTPA